MIVGTGVDITEVDRIQAAVKRFGDRFLHRVFTPAEVRLTWQDVEVIRLPGQRPTLEFHGKAAEFAAMLGCKRTHLSLSHTKEQAIAYVILEGE
jgi:holo-[acyl-carrier protein] synthase